MLYGGIELGGTKMVCGIANEKGELLEKVTFQTTTPEETLPKLLDYFKDKNIELSPKNPLITISLISRSE